MSRKGSKKKLGYPRHMKKPARFRKKKRERKHLIGVDYEKNTPKIEEQIIKRSLLQKVLSWFRRFLRW